MYYASFGVLSLILHIIINYELLMFRKNEDISPANIRYKRFLYSVMVYYFSDIMWGILYEWHLIPLVYADTVLYFVSMVLSVLLWTRYVVKCLDSRNFLSSLLIYSGRVIVIYVAANLALNFFKPVLFSFNENMIYEPKNARYIIFGMLMIFYLVTGIYTLIMAVRTEGKTRRHYMTIGLSGIVMSVFIVFQTLDPFLPFYAVGCLIATCLVNTFVSVDEKLEYEIELRSAKQKAYTDSLTGAKNPHAYEEDRNRLDQRIKDGRVKSFGVVVFDLNGLKATNDTMGHEAGNSCIKEACDIICRYFKNSPVYRIGGDEFAVFLEGDDYNDRKSLLDAFERQMDKNQTEDGIVISSGMSEYVPKTDHDYNTVFERADKKMYERKKVLKSIAR